MGTRCEEALEVQSILFQRDQWTFFEALQWIEENPEFHVYKVDLTEDYIRIRQYDPDLFDKTSFRTITFSERKGIKAITACPRGYYRRENPGFTKDTFLDPSQGGVNMSVEELRAWAKDPRHKLASTAVGHYSLTRIPELVQKPERNWTEDDYEWAQKVVNFNYRHLQQVVKAHEERGGKGGFGSEVGRSGYSKRHIALLNWGHDPGKEDSPAFEADSEWQEEQ